MYDQYLKGIETDWVDEILKDGPALSQNYNLSIRGGSKDARYAASIGYYDEDGILIENSKYRRYSFRINSDYNLGKIFRVGENLVITQNENTGMPTPISGIRTSFSEPVWIAMGSIPLYPVLKDSAEINDPNYEYNKYEAEYNNNPVASLHRIHTLNKTLSIFGNIFAEATFFKAVTFRSSFGLNISSSFIDDFHPEYYLRPDDMNDQSEVKNTLYRTNGWLWENTLTYHKTFQKHSITAVAGYTAEQNIFDYMHASKFGTPTNDVNMRTLDAAISNPIAKGSFDEVNMISLLGRLNYVYGDRYLVTASIRRDGTSKFGPDHKWGNFPSVALGWKISSEGFFESLKSGFMPMLKLRAGWGQIGNSSMTEHNTNAYVSQVATSPRLRALFNEMPYSGYFYETIGTPSLGWETAEQANIGLDIGMFRYALNITADYFVKNTKDMLVRVEVPSYAGYGMDNEPWINAGSVENKGFEYIVRYKGNLGKFRYEISTNGTSYKNKVTSTNPDSTEILIPDVPTKTLIGSPIGSFFGYVTDGIFQTEDEVLGHVNSTGVVIQPNAIPGDFRFKDLDNNGELTAEDMTIIGNPHPKFIYGFSINLGFHGFDLMTMWQGVYGNDLWNRVLIKQGALNGTINVFRDRYQEAWRGEGTSNSQPMITKDASNNNYRDSDYFVEDGSYLRMKIIQLGYSLPISIIQKLNIESCRIWIGGTDLITFTNYSGNDPEVGMDNPLYSGFDGIGTYPKNRKIIVGINIEF